MNKLSPFGAFAVAMAFVAALAMGSQACGGDENIPFSDDSGGRRPGSSNGGNGDTLPQGLSACNATCTADDECGDCPGDQTSCDVTQGVCIACGPNAGGRTCSEGKECTQYGYCVPRGTECPVDGTGVPTIECNDDAACAACSPDYRVCNPSTKKCSKCNPAAEPAPGSLCQTTEACSPQGTCEPRCPEGCANDGQCSKCGDPGGPAANVCTRGECAECNPTRPDNGGCGEGTKCGDNGVCEPKCGDNGNAPLECDDNADCARCGDVSQQDNGAGAGDDGAQGVIPAAVAWSCKKPGAGKGKCVPNLSGGEEGCRALGAQVLPSPFNKVTTLCDDDSSCEGTGVSFNVGGLLSKVTDLPGISNEAMLYPMKRCAKMEILGNDLPCGICVPCKEDADCKDINIIESVGSVFGPVGSLLSRVLSSAIFGDDPPIIYMTCSKVFGDFGACVPCSSILTACGDKATGGTDGGTGNNDDCVGRERGWYCSGLDRPTGYFCPGGTDTNKKFYFCAGSTPHCQAENASSAKAKTVTPDASDGQEQDGKIPECSATPDPAFESRAFGDADAGGGAEGLLP